ncbi:hypothetical protein [Kribbella sp. DT2]|uniref:hypothetical protein n=1 Tax=Kribbella sp. DT2 TaxID=3393427 RepID=UPI003CF60469
MSDPNPEAPLRTPEEAGKALYDLGTRLFTLTATAPGFDLGVIRDWLAWRDEMNAKG